MKNVFFSGSSPVKNKKTPFLTQADLLKDSLYERSGVCAILTNAWLKKRIEGSEAAFLRDKNETIEAINTHAHIQEKLYSEGEKNINCSAFISTSTPYVTKQVPRKELVQSEKLDKLIGGSRFAIFSYPTKREKHMVAFENQLDSNNSCRLFDANLPGGELKAPCPELKSVFSQLIKRNMLEQDIQASVYLAASERLNIN